MHIHSKQKYISGFTLIELMITIGIIVLVTGLVLLKYSSFNSSVLLKSQAYAVAFDLREAQSLAISVRGQEGEFREEYGIYFSTASPGSYILFQDDDDIADHARPRYNAGEEIGNPIMMDPRFEIIDICVDGDSGVECDRDNVSITFKRPDFDASFFTQGVSNIQSAEIRMAAIGDSTFSKTVVVYQTGQIEVK